MKKVLAVGTALLFLAVAAAVWAGPPDQIRARMKSMQQRIDEGNRSGALTGQEAKRVQVRLNNIRESFENAVLNGLTEREAKLFNQRLDVLGKDVSKEKRDPETTRSGGQIDHRIAELQKRIDEGSRRGTLTPVETKNLQHRLDAIRGQYERAQRDGILKDEEIHSIQGRLDNLAKSISKERSDRERSR